MIIDFHTHTFPAKIAEKALPKLAVTAGGVKPRYDGTPGGLRDYIKSSEADAAVVLNIATNAKQEANVNAFAREIDGGELVSFGSVHPDSPDVLETLEALAAAGIKGIKLHPDYQHFFVDDEKMLPIYEKIAELGLITVFHSGIDIGYPDPVHCTPERLARVLPAFGGAAVVAAHMGGWMMWREVLETLCGRDVYFDTAFSSSRMPPDYAREIIRAHGADRVLLGSDMPWSGTDEEIAFVRSLGLSREDEEKILGGNAKRLLGI